MLGLSKFLIIGVMWGPKYILYLNRVSLILIEERYKQFWSLVNQRLPQTFLYTVFKTVLKKIRLVINVVKVVIDFRVEFSFFLHFIVNVRSKSEDGDIALYTGEGGWDSRQRQRLGTARYWRMTEIYWHQFEAEGWRLEFAPHKGLRVLCGIIRDLVVPTLRFSFHFNLRPYLQCAGRPQAEHL